MALRKQVAKRTKIRADLTTLIKEKRGQAVTEEELAEQRISFAFGNAMNLKHVTKDSVRTTSQRVRLKVS